LRQEQLEEVGVSIAPRVNEVEQPLMVEDVAHSFIVGLKKPASARIAESVLRVNSYKRLVGAPTSGATWAPACVRTACASRELGSDRNR
jgi:glutamine synthetase